MSDAIKELHDYLAKSPSVVYPEDVLAYLPAIKDENAKLRELVRNMYTRMVELEDENAKLRELCETFGIIANDAVCDYYERDEMLEQANADARELEVVL